jgi:hypothetical protein
MALFDSTLASSNVSNTSAAVIAAATATTSALQTKYTWLFEQIATASRSAQASTQAAIPAADYSALSALLIGKGYAVSKTDVVTQHILPDSTVSSPDVESVARAVITVTWAVIDGTTVTPIAQPIPAAAPAVEALVGLNLTSFQAVQGTPLNIRFIPQGGVAPYWFTTTGNTPGGLTWGSKSKVPTLTLQGTPTTPAIEYATLAITVADSAGQTVTAYMNWIISPAPVV